MILLKNLSQHVLTELGLDMSTALKLSLKQIVVTQSTPFPLITENALTPQEEAEILQASKEAQQGINLSPFLPQKKELQGYLDSIKNGDQIS